MYEIIGGLIGAFVVAILAVFGYWWEKRQEQKRIQERVVQRYLLQLQDAMESLWYRLDNVRNRGGQAVMDRAYYYSTTLYALANALAYKRILLLDGIYHQMGQIKMDDLRLLLRKTLLGIESRLENIAQNHCLRFYHYHRQVLAEAVMEREEDHWRTSTYLEFMLKYEDPNSPVKAFLEPAKDAINTFGPQESDLEKTLDEVRHITEEVIKETEFPTTLPSR